MGISISPVLRCRLDEIQNNYQNINREEIHTILNKYWEDAYKYLNVYSMLKDYNKNIDIDSLEWYYEAVKDELNIVYNSVLDDNLFQDIMDWFKDTTNIWALYWYLQKEWVNNNVAREIAKQMIYLTWLEKDRWLIGSIAYWWSALIGNIWELVLYTVLIESWVWLAWWWAKAVQLWRFLKWWEKIIKNATLFKKMDNIKKIWIFSKIKTSDKVFKNTLYNYYLKQGLLFWTVNMVHSSINTSLRWIELSKWDMLKYFMEWFAYWTLWELWALKTLQTIKWKKGIISAIWVSAWINTSIDYMINWKIDNTSIISNIAFWLLDVHFAHNSTTNLVKTTELNNKQIEIWGEVLKENKIDKPIWNTIFNKIKEIIEKCL